LQLKVCIKQTYKEYGQDYSVEYKPQHKCTRLIELPLAKKHIFLQNIHNFKANTIKNYFNYVKRYTYVNIRLTCLVNILNPKICASNKKQPMYGYEEKAYHV